MISIFTPTHNPRHLRRLESSLKTQTNQDFEWVIVPNGVSLEGEWHNAKIIPFEASSIGGLKKFACEQAKGDLLVEVDHDDELFPNALEEVAAAFQKPHVDFVYSNSCDVRDGKPYRFSDAFGWKYRNVEFNGQQLLETVAFKATPVTLSQIWFCPNHIRAWRRSFYEKIGGHSDTFLDDQDLLCRTYIEGWMDHIDKPLYVYHIHDDNSFRERAGHTVAACGTLYDKYIKDMVKRWCELHLLLYTKVEGARYYGHWPFRKGEVGAFVLNNPEIPQKKLLKQISRSLADNGWVFLDTTTPWTRSAVEDMGFVIFRSNINKGRLTIDFMQQQSHVA